MLGKIKKLALDIIAPPFCFYCRKFIDIQNYLCETCLSKIEPVSSINLKVTDKLSMAVYAAAAYKDPLKSIIFAKSFSMPFMSEYLADFIWQRSALQNINFDYLVPIPLHWTREAWRGFNQSEIIANKLSKVSGKPVLNILKRARRTAFQSSQLSCERNKNVEGAFVLESAHTELVEVCSGQVFLLVDDLMTTGATLQSAAKVLGKLRPKAICAAVACRTV